MTRRIIGILSLLAILVLPGCKQLRLLRELEDAVEENEREQDVRDSDDGDDSGDASTADVDAGRDTSDAPDAVPDTISIDTAEVESADAEPEILPDPPSIWAVYPNAGPESGGTIIAVEGQFLTSDVEARLGGVDVTFIDFVDEYLLYLRTPPHAPGLVDLKLSTRGGDTVYEGAFTYEADLNVEAAVPSAGDFRGGYPIEVFGTGFRPETRVIVGDREATSVVFVSETQLRVTWPPAESRGLADIIAFDDRVDRLAEGFTFTQAPEVHELIPPIGSPRGGDLIRLGASGLTADCVIYFGAQPAPVARSVDGWWTVTSPGGGPGVIDVSLDCGAAGSQFLPAAFTYAASDALELLGILPDSGFSRGGQIVAVYGHNMDAITSVTFDGVQAEIFGGGPNHVEVMTPAWASEASVSVAAFVGDELVGSLPFSYFAQPLFTRLEPASGSPSGGWTAGLFGQELEFVSEIFVDGHNVEILERGSDSLSFAVPPGALGPASVAVGNGTLRYATGFFLNYQVEQGVQSMFPAEAAASGGGLVYLLGNGFGEDCVVTVDGIPASSSVFASSLIVFVAPPHEPGAADVVISGCFDASFQSGLRYIDPTITVGGVGFGGIDGELRVSVIELGTGDAIAGATVMVSVRDDSPYVGFTDDNGEITFVGDDLVGPQTVTAFTADRSTESVVDVNARHVTLSLNQLPPEPCPDPADPACAPPPPPPTGRIIGFLTGLRKAEDPPPGAVLQARIATTVYAAGWINPDPGPLSTLFEDGAFDITTRLGEMALVAYCGHFTPATGEFVPKRLGVVRAISIREFDEPIRLTVDCNIELNQPISVKLAAAPELVPEPLPGEFPAEYRASVVFELGAEGSIDALPGFTFYDSVYTHRGFPPLDGPLQNVTFDLTVGAYPEGLASPSALAYARFIGGYTRVVSFPPMIPMPTLTRPSLEDPVLTDGYIEWDLVGVGASPDFYQVSIYAANPTFSRWSVYVPGDRRSLNLADYPEYTEALGALATPEAPESFLTVFIRAIDADVFDYNDFDRYILRSRNWRATSSGYFSVSLPQPAEIVP